MFHPCDIWKCDHVRLVVGQHWTTKAMLRDTMGRSMLFPPQVKKKKQQQQQQWALPCVPVNHCAWNIWVLSAPVKTSASHYWSVVSIEIGRADGTCPCELTLVIAFLYSSLVIGFFCLMTSFGFGLLARGVSETASRSVATSE